MSGGGLTRGLAALSMLSLGACGSGARPVQCEVTSLAECHNGFFFSDCGGDGEPTFGCEVEDCRWFSGGCAPPSYGVSPCPAEDLCCDGSPWWGDDPVPPIEFWNITQLGIEAWDGVTAADLVVTVDATLEAVEAGLSCDDPTGGQTPCGAAPLRVRRSVADTLYVTLGSATEVEGYRLGVEIIEDDMGGLAARACRMPFSDVMTVCEPRPACATSGTLRIGAWPLDATTVDSIPVEVELVFDDGVVVTGAF